MHLNCIFSKIITFSGFHKFWEREMRKVFPGIFLLNCEIQRGLCGTNCFRKPLAKPPKKVLFLMVWPLRPYTPPPSGLMSVGFF